MPWQDDQEAKGEKRPPPGFSSAGVKEGATRQRRAVRLGLEDLSYRLSPLGKQLY